MRKHFKVFFFQNVAIISFLKPTWLIVRNTCNVLAFVFEELNVESNNNIKIHFHSWQLLLFVEKYHGCWLLVGVISNISSLTIE